MAAQPITTQLPVCPVMRTDVADAVRAALAQKGRAPFIGIACGAKTVLIKRDLFKKSLAGLRIVDAELVTADEGMVRGQYRRINVTGGSYEHDTDKDTYERVPERVSYDEPATYRATHAIRVYAAAKGVKATRLFLHQDPREYSNRKMLWAWKESELKKTERTKVSKHEAAIRRLEKRLKKLGPLQRPKNPCLAGTNADFPGGFSREWHEWHLQKPVRKAVMALARRGKKDLTSAQLYKELEKLTVPAYRCENFLEIVNWTGEKDTSPEPIYKLIEKPLSFTKWGEVTGNERDRKGVSDIWEYLARLWEFCGLREKPSSYDYYMPKWGPERYYTWQEARDERRQIESEIAAIREMEKA